MKTHQKHIGKWLGAFALILGEVATGNAQSVIGFNFTDLTANPSSGTQTNLSVSGFTLGNSHGTVTTPVNITSASNVYTVPAEDGGGGFSGGGNLGNAVAVGAFDPSVSSYYEVTITPLANFNIELTNFDFGGRSTGTGPISYSFRSSVDSFATSILTGTFTANSAWSFKDNANFTLDGTGGAAVRVRLYTYDGAGNAQAGTENNRLDDIFLTVNAIPIAAPEPGTVTALLGAALLAGVRGWRHRRMA